MLQHLPLSYSVHNVPALCLSLPSLNRQVISRTQGAPLAYPPSWSPLVVDLLEGLLQVRGGVGGGAVGREGGVFCWQPMRTLLWYAGIAVVTREVVQLMHWMGCTRVRMHVAHSCSA
jgi:hypothetical protein